MLSYILTKLRLSFVNSAQEREYNTLKAPLNTGFSQNLLLGITLFSVLPTVNFFMLGLKLDSYLALAFNAFGALTLLLRKRVGGYIRHVSIIYICFLATNTLIHIPVILTISTTTDAFYMGYSFALMTKLVDFRVNKFYVALVIHAIFITARNCVIVPMNIPQGILTISLEVIPIILSFNAEKADRDMFDSLYKSKNLLLKFKQLLAEYLPNPIAVFSSVHSQMLFINNAFKKVFETNNSSNSTDVLDTLAVDVQNSDENRSLLDKLNSRNSFDSVKRKELSLLDLLKLLNQNKWIFHNSSVISFQLIEQTQNSECISGKENPQQPHGFDFSRSSSKVEENSVMDRSHLYLNKKDMDATTTPFIAPRSGLSPKKQASSKNDATASKSHSRIFKVKVFQLTWDDQEALAIVLDDVTHERTIMELKIADKNKDLVIAMVSHELRTPINGIMGMLEIMRKEIFQPQILGYLNACKTNSRLLLNLVNSILDFSQIKHSKLKLVYSRVVLLDLLNEIKSLFDHFCQMKNLFLNIEIDSDIPEILITDQTRLSQIIINLVGNAFKFTFKGGVTIKVTLISNRIKFCIIDTGIGIKKEDQQKLFKVFGKLEQEDKKINTQGVGLGLTISNDLVILLDSNEKKGIQVESEVGKGTTFSFCIQLETKDKLDEIIVGKSDDEESCLEGLEEIQASLTVLEKVMTHTEVASKRALFLSQQSRNTILQDSSFRNEIQMRYSRFSSSKQNDRSETGILDSRNRREVGENYWCLIVDDNPFNLMIATSVMKERGYQVKTALTGQEAINAVKDHNSSAGPLKVILMDCHMPLMDGYEASRILTQMMRDREIEECPIIALTANNKDEEHDKVCKDASMSGCVQKPLNANELEEMLKIFVKQKGLVSNK